MTKKEFYLKTIISMCGNPAYVEVKDLNDEEGKEACMGHTLQIDEIIMDADRILRETEDAWEDAFDEQSDGDNIGNTICELTDEMSKSLMSLDRIADRLQDSDF